MRIRERSGGDVTDGKKIVWQDIPSPQYESDCAAEHTFFHYCSTRSDLPFLRGTRLTTQVYGRKEGNSEFVDLS